MQSVYSSVGHHGEVEAFNTTRYVFFIDKLVLFTLTVRENSEVLKKIMIRVRLHTGDYLEALAIYNDDVLVHNRKKDMAQFVSRKEIMEWYGGCSKQLPVLDVKPYSLTR